MGLRHGNRYCVAEDRAGRLEVHLANGPAIPTAAVKIAARPVARGEFEAIDARGDRADVDIEGSIAVDVGPDHAEFDRRGAFRYALPSERCARAAWIGVWELAEGGRKCLAEKVSRHLVELVRIRMNQEEADRQRLRACLRLRREQIGIGRGTVCVSDRRGIPESANV